MRKFSPKVHCNTDNGLPTQTTSTEDHENNKNGITDIGKLPIVYCSDYRVKFCGLEHLHPFDAAKGYHILKHLKERKFMTDHDVHQPSEITKEELLKVHTKKYLKSLKWSVNAAKISEILPLMFVPNYFVQRGYLRPMRFQAAGSILAGKLALLSGWSINLGGGFHHCCAYKGGGFCPYADITLLVNRIFEQEPQIDKIMIIDLDAHQGNGHERDFMDNDKVFIFDMYNSAIYPRDHSAKLAIKCAVELKPHTNDPTYLKKLKTNLLKCLTEFRPDFVVYNAGTDILAGDPLGILSISPEGVIERDELVFSNCRKQAIPIVMLLSGGYLRISAKVIADSILNMKQKRLLVT